MRGKEALRLPLGEKVKQKVCRSFFNSKEAFLLTQKSF